MNNSFVRRPFPAALKSPGANAPSGFDSRPRHQRFSYLREVVRTDFRVSGCRLDRGVSTSSAEPAALCGRKGMKVVPQGGESLSCLLPLFVERSEARLFLGDVGKQVVAWLGHGRCPRGRRADAAGALPQLRGSATVSVCFIGEVVSQLRDTGYTSGACDIHKNHLYWCISQRRLHQHGTNEHRNR